MTKNMKNFILPLFGVMAFFSNLSHGAQDDNYYDFWKPWKLGNILCLETLKTLPSAPAGTPTHHTRKQSSQAGAVLKDKEQDLVLNKQQIIEIKDTSLPPQKPSNTKIPGTILFNNTSYKQNIIAKIYQAIPNHMSPFSSYVDWEKIARNTISIWNPDNTKSFKSFSAFIQSELRVHTFSEKAKQNFTSLFHAAGRIQQRAEKDYIQIIQAQILKRQREQTPNASNKRQRTS